MTPSLNGDSEQDDDWIRHAGSNHELIVRRALKAVSGRLAERARTEGWGYETYLAAALTDEVSSRDSHGGVAP